MAKPLNKQERTACYSARDSYFQCLDKNDDDLYKCVKQRDDCEMKCPKAWVKHFEQTRVAKEIIDIQKANAAKQYSKNS